MTVKMEIPQLTGLRVVAALWVFVFHACHLARESSTFDFMRALGGAGYLGVDVFFVLSGFVLALNYGADRLHQSPIGWWRFLWKRLARIYPVHLVTLALVPVAVLALAANDTPFHRMDVFTTDGLLRSLTLTHAWFEPIPRTWNLVSWSISCEWAAYLAFPLIAAATHRLHSAAAIVATIAGLMVALFWVIQFEPFGEGVALDMQRISAEFSAGVLLHRLWLIRGRPKTPTWDLIACAAAGVLVFGSNAAGMISSMYAPFSVAPVLACVLVYGLTCASGPFARLLSRPALQYAGAVSYSFYLVHGTVLLCTRSVLLERGLTTDATAAVVSILIAFLVTCALAHWIYQSIERTARAQMLLWMDQPARRSAGKAVDSST